MFSYTTLLLGISLTALAPLLSRRTAIGFVVLYLCMLAAMGLSPLTLPLMLRASDSEMLLTAGLLNLLAAFRLIGPGPGTTVSLLRVIVPVAMLAACWTASLASVGLGLELAVLLTLLLPAVVLLLIRRPAFAPTALRREAQLLCAALCLGAVFVMEAIQGWQQFTALQAELPGAGAVSAGVPMLMVATAFALGLLWQGWWLARKR
jgi:hypothetical protein